MLRTELEFLLVYEILSWRGGHGGIWHRIERHMRTSQDLTLRGDTACAVTLLDREVPGARRRKMVTDDPLQLGSALLDL